MKPVSWNMFSFLYKRRHIEDENENIILYYAPTTYQNGYVFDHSIHFVCVRNMCYIWIFLTFRVFVVYVFKTYLNNFLIFSEEQ